VFSQPSAENTFICEGKDYTSDELLTHKKNIEKLINKDAEAANLYVNQLVSCFQLSKNNSNKIIVLLIHGLVLEKTSEYDQAVEKFELALSLAEKHKIKKLEIEALYRLGHVYSLKEFQSLALEYYLVAADLATELGNREIITEINLLLGEYYRKVVQYDLALKYLTKAKNDILKGQLPVSYEIRMLNRFAAVWSEMNTNYDSIVQYSQKSIELAKSIGDLHSEALAYNEMGARSEFFTSEERIAFYHKAKNIWSELGYRRYEALPIISLVNSECVPQNDYEKAIELINYILPYLPDNCWEKDVLFQQLSGSYEALGDFESALIINKKRFLTFSKGVAELNNKQIEELSLKYETDKTKEELNIKSNELALEQTEKKFYALMVFALIIISVIILVFTWFNHTKNKKLKSQKENITIKSEQLTALLSDKEVLLKEINHRVKNNMIMVSSILEMQQETTKDDNIKSSLQVGIDRVRSLTYAHQQLYQTENYTNIELNSYVKQITENLILGNDVAIDLNFDKVYDYPIEKSQALGFVLNELITNSIKHAWKKNSDLQKKEINIEITEKENFIVVKFKDNGEGIDHEIIENEAAGLGMMLINSFVKRQLGGDLSIINENGANIIFTCKKV
jgi:two-component sensor histidine kinase